MGYFDVFPKVRAVGVTHNLRDTRQLAKTSVIKQLSKKGCPKTSHDKCIPRKHYKKFFVSVHADYTTISSFDVTGDGTISIS